MDPSEEGFLSVWYNLTDSDGFNEVNDEYSGYKGRIDLIMGAFNPAVVNRLGKVERDTFIKKGFVDNREEEDNVFIRDHTGEKVVLELNHFRNMTNYER